jgi:hypothetical protein
VALVAVAVAGIQPNHLQAGQVLLGKAKAVVLDFHQQQQIELVAVVAVLMLAAVVQVQLLLVMAATA